MILTLNVSSAGGGGGEPGVAPVISSTSPTNGSIGSNASDPITITFDKNIQAGTGNIYVRVANEAGTFSTADTIDVSTDVGTGDGQYSISGAVLTIYPATKTDMRRYAIQMDSGAIESTDSGVFGGIANDTTVAWISGTGRTIPTIAGNTYSSTVTSQTNPTIAADTKYVSCTFSSICNIEGSEGSPITNIGFDTCDFTNSSGNGADLRWAEDILFEDCTFGSAGAGTKIGGTGIRMRSSGSTARVSIVGCTLSDLDDNGISAAKRSQPTSGNPQVDHVDILIHDCTVDTSGVTGTGGSQHGIYLQGTDFTIQNTSILTEVDGNAISVRTAGTVFNCTVNCISVNDSTGAGIKYFGDHLAGPLTAPRTNDPWYVCFNTVNGQNDLYNGIEVRKATNSSSSPYIYTDAEWYINDAHIYENTVSNCTNANYAYNGWSSPAYLDIYEDGVLQSI